MTKYIIVDDESVGHEIIQDYCNLLPDMHLQKSCYDAIEAAEYLRDQEVDLIFLDLNMPKIKGFEFLRTLPDPPKVIVTTAYQEYALEGYELNVADYLLKPFSFERFLSAVNKAMHKPERKSGRDSASSSVFLQSNKKYIRVDLDKILYLEASGNYTKIFTKESVTDVREKISDLLIVLQNGDLCQVHKSFAVSKKYVDSVEGNRIFIGENIVPLGKTFRADFLKSL